MGETLQKMFDFECPVTLKYHIYYKLIIEYYVSTCVWFVFLENTFDELGFLLVDQNIITGHIQPLQHIGSTQEP